MKTVRYISNKMIKIKDKMLGFGDPLEVTDVEYEVLLNDKYFMDDKAYQQWQNTMKKVSQVSNTIPGPEPVIEPEPKPKSKRKVRK